MPGIVAGALLAHPPILLPEVGGAESDRVRATADAIRTLDQTLAAQPADLIILVSPHSPAGLTQLPVRRTARAAGNLSRFRAPQVEVRASVDVDLAADVVREAAAAGFPMGWTDDSVLDHGVVVPLHFLERTRADKPFLFFGICDWPLAQFARFGAWLHARLQERSVIFIASGDLSHRLMPGAPAGYRPQGRAFDELVVDALRQQQWDRIEGLDADFVEEAGECGLRPLVMLLGAARAAGLGSDVLHYEGPFGVGYPVVGFFAPAHAQLDVQELARRAITHYVHHREYLEPPEPIPPGLRSPCALFVTLRKDGEMRGCVGNLHPTLPTAAHELVKYAVAAALRDPRFPPVTLDEVGTLSVSVQLLDPPEPVDGSPLLDPTQYGLVVRSGERQGLLLPGLVDIVTPEQQILAACIKAGISQYAPLELWRFRTRPLE